jgi:hypothetical protein
MKQVDSFEMKFDGFAYEEKDLPAIRDILEDTVRGVFTLLLNQGVITAIESHCAQSKSDCRPDDKEKSRPKRSGSRKSSKTPKVSPQSSTAKSRSSKSPSKKDKDR